MIKTSNLNLDLNTGTIIFNANMDFSNPDLNGKILEIKDTIDLKNNTINLPNKCTLFFNGGYLTNGLLVLQNTLIKAHSTNLFKNISFEGYFSNSSLDVKWFGAKGDGKKHVNNSSNIDYNTNAMQIAINTANPNGGKIFIPNGTFKLTKNIILKSNICFEGNGVGTTIKLEKSHIDFGIYTTENILKPLIQPTIYYKNEHIQSSDFSKGFIDKDALIGQTELKVSTIKGLLKGDYLYLSNGYCDMWRVMEDGDNDSLNNHKWLNEDVRLWESEIVRIKDINKIEKLIILESPLNINIYKNPITHGLFPNTNDENNLANYNGFNIPSFERLSGANNIHVSNFNIIISGVTTAAIRATLSHNCTINNLKIIGQGKGIEIFSCKNFKINKITTEVNQFGISARRGSEGVSITDVNCLHSGGNYDALVLLWENTYNSLVNGAILNSINGTNGVRGGIYLNTCHSNIVSNVVAKNLKTVVYLGFSTGKGKCIANNINAINSDRILSIHACFNAIISNISITRNLNKFKNIYDDVGIKISVSNNITINNFTDNSTYNKETAEGRIHIWKSFKIVMNNIFSPSLILWDSIADAGENNLDQKRLICNNGEFHSLKSSYDYNTNVFPKDTRRESEFKNLLIHNDLSLEFTKHALIDNCKILGKISTGLDLYSSPYTKVINSEIYGKTAVIDFQKKGQAGGLSSHIYISNTIIEDREKLKDYKDLTYTNSINKLDKNFKQGQRISLLNDYPLIHEIVHVSDKEIWPINLKSPSIL